MQGLFREGERLNHDSLDSHEEEECLNHDSLDSLDFHEEEDLKSGKSFQSQNSKFGGVTQGSL